MKYEDIQSLTLSELEEALTAAGFPGFRASQVYRWLHVQMADSCGQMNNIPASLKAWLEEHYSFTRISLADRQVSALDGTQKFLFALEEDGGENLIESVFMKYKYGNSVCISSQVGCRMGCTFCASTLGGLVRNLLPSEMLAQIYAIRKLTGEKISHVVVMGTGEPFDNYDHLVRFLHLLTDENGQHLSQRNITVSTCGIVERIYDFAREDLSVTLALSLHAATDEKRRKIMPVANRYTIRELTDACLYYFKRTGRRVTFEYSLIAGVNDTDADAAQLAGLAAKVKAHINLIPVNPVTENSYRQPTADAVAAFKNKLEKQGINVSIRRVLGRDIDGACGQLRLRHRSAGQLEHRTAGQQQ